MLMCVCGHSKDEHGNDPEYPGSTACNHEKCDCIAYEEDDDEEDDPGEGFSLAAIVERMPLPSEDS